MRRRSSHSLLRSPCERSHILVEQYSPTKTSPASASSPLRTIFAFGENIDLTADRCADVKPRRFMKSRKILTSKQGKEIKQRENHKVQAEARTEEVKAVEERTEEDKAFDATNHIVDHARFSWVDGETDVPENPYLRTGEGLRFKELMTTGIRVLKHHRRGAKRPEIRVLYADASMGYLIVGKKETKQQPDANGRNRSDQGLTELDGGSRVFEFKYLNVTTKGNRQLTLSVSKPPTNFAMDPGNNGPMTSKKAAALSKPVTLEMQTEHSQKLLLKFLKLMANGSDYGLNGELDGL